ncbi:helix-turn-helix domain-containing protein [[Clostridium] aminophilum]|uniref:helix-turn-helix domain-containing protein n=1 Tax=[Clostridium] aminophilum TaxID=1526 RepID=UPI002ED65D86
MKNVCVRYRMMISLQRSAVINMVRGRSMKEQSLGRFISARRKKMRLTQEELADKVNVSKSAVAKWETDGGLPDRDNLKRIAEVMNVSVDDLHRVIKKEPPKSFDLSVNITPEVIAVLEAHGYIVISPDGEGER